MTVTQTTTNEEIGKFIKDNPTLTALEIADILHDNDRVKGRTGLN